MNMVVYKTVKKVCPDCGSDVEEMSDGSFYCGECNEFISADDVAEEEELEEAEDYAKAWGRGYYV